MYANMPPKPLMVSGEKGRLLKYDMKAVDEDDDKDEEEEEEEDEAWADAVAAARATVEGALECIRSAVVLSRWDSGEDSGDVAAAAAAAASGR
jgi:hypothetical protein